MDPKDKALLDQLGRQGWSIVSKTPTYETIGGSYPGERIPKYPEGSEQWIITDGKGHNQTLVVQPAAQPGPVAGSNAYNPNPTVVEPPKDTSPPQNTPNAQTTTVNGVTYERGADGQWKPAAGLPTDAGKPSTAAPSDPSKWQQIKAPDGRTIALQDPVTGDRVAVPQDSADKLPDGTTKDTIESGRQVHWVAKGGQWTIQNVGGKIDSSGMPQEGQKRRSVQGQYAVTEIYHNGVWSLDDTTPPTRFDPGAPKEGDVRPNTDNKGQAIQEVYRGGSWVTDTSVPPKPFGTQAPTTVATAADQPNIVQRDPTTGAISTVPNPNYRPTDVASRVQQLQQLAQAKRDELNKAVSSGQKSPDQAAAEFDTWWSTTIDPQAQQLTQQQATAQADEQRRQTAEERANAATAGQAGRDAVAAAQAGLANRVGPGFGAALNQITGAYGSGKAPGNLDLASAVTYQMPDFSQIAEQATAQALAHLSPTAAGKVGGAVPSIPQGVDIAGALNKSTYAPTTTIAPDGTVTIQHQAQQQPPPLDVYRPPALAAPVGPARGPLYG